MIIFLVFFHSNFDGLIHQFCRPNSTKSMIITTIIKHFVLRHAVAIARYNEHETISSMQISFYDYFLVVFPKFVWISYANNIGNIFSSTPDRIYCLLIIVLDISPGYSDTKCVHPINFGTFFFFVFVLFRFEKHERKHVQCSIFNDSIKYRNRCNLWLITYDITLTYVFFFFLNIQNDQTTKA